MPQRILNAKEIARLANVVIESMPAADEAAIVAELHALFRREGFARPEPEYLAVILDAVRVVRAELV